MPRSPFDPPYSGPDALRSALRPGHDFAGWDLSGLLQDLDRQREHIETIIAGENPRAAADWLFAMMDACRERFGQIRNDDGELVAWWDEDLVVAWIRARQSVRAPAKETVALLLEQLRLFDEEASVEGCWVKALNAAGLRALEEELLRRVRQIGRGPIRERHRRAIDAIRGRRRRVRRPVEE